MKTIRILVDTEGNLDLTTEGFTGTECQQARQALNLGEPVTEELTPEYFEGEFCTIKTGA